MSYLWTDGLEPPEFPALSGDEETEVLIVGGGMAGILCARELRDRGVRCMVLEADKIGGGTTRGTTAVLTAQHDTMYQDIAHKFDVKTAAAYLNANLRAVARFREYAQKWDCDFEERPSVMYSAQSADVLQREEKILRTLGFPAEYTDAVPLPVAIQGALRFPGMAQFHPIKFLYAAARGLDIREHSRVAGVEDMCAFTERGRVRAKKIIIATRYPILNKRGMYFARLCQTRSFVVALENAPSYTETYVDADNGWYFRSYKDLLIVGGGDHRTGRREGGFPSLRDFVRTNFPDAREKFAWAAQDCVSLDGIPYIGQYSPAAPDILVATGFNEWGMTSSMLAAEILADEVTGAESEYAAAFSPRRSVMRRQLAENLAVTAGSFLTPTAPRCPHMGCALRKMEGGDYECACHGSRFSPAGELLDGPATRGLKNP